MTPAIVALESAGVLFDVVSYEHDASVSSYGLEAVAALDVEAESVFKTLMAELDDGSLVVACVPATAMLDLRGLARAAGAKKAVMADPVVAERSTGYVRGGISPFGQRRMLRTFVDETVELFDAVHVSAGRRGLEVSLAPADLLRVTDATVADIGR